MKVVELRVRCVGVGQRPQGNADLWYADFSAYDGETSMTQHSCVNFTFITKDAAKFQPGREYTLILTP